MSNAYGPQRANKEASHASPSYNTNTQISNDKFTYLSTYLISHKIRLKCPQHNIPDELYSDPRL